MQVLAALVEQEPRLLGDRGARRGVDGKRRGLEQREAVGVISAAPTSEPSGEPLTDSTGVSVISVSDRSAPAGIDSV